MRDTHELSIDRVAGQDISSLYRTVLNILSGRDDVRGVEPGRSAENERGSPSGVFARRWGASVPTSQRKARLRLFGTHARILIAMDALVAFVNEANLTLGVDVGAIALITVALGLEKRSQRDRTACWLFLLGVCAQLLGSSLFDGQLYSMSLWLYPLVSVAAAFLLGMGATILWTLIGVGAILLFAFAPDAMPMTTEQTPTLHGALCLRLCAAAWMSSVAWVVSTDSVNALRERAQRNQVLRAAQQEVERSDHLKNAFLAQASHEIRTPMNGILGMVQHLRAMRGLSAEALDHVKSIERCSEGLLAILRDVLDLSRVESGDWSLNESPVDLVELLDDIASLFRTQAVVRGQELRFVSDHEQLWVRTDATRIRQVVSNLLGNAVKFCEDGDIEINVWTQPKTAAEPGVLQEVFISVSDQGVGMAPEQMEALFGEFEQLTLVDGVNRGGTGLGLAISRQIISKMNGDIQVQSELDKGSTFTVALKLERCAHATPLHTSRGQLPLPQTDEQCARPQCVLIVDDLALNRRVAALALQRLGYSSQEAHNGQQAIEAARQTRFDLILMDLRMPIMGGLQAAQQLKKEQGPNQQTPIVALTASAYAQDRQACLNAGMVDHLAKPFRIEALRDILETHIRTDRVPTAGMPALEQTGGVA